MTATLNGIEFTGPYMRVQVIADTEDEAREFAIEHTGIDRIEWSDLFHAEDNLWEVTFERYAEGDE